MNRRVARALPVVAVAALAAACSTPDQGPRVTPAPAAPSVSAPVPTASPLTPGSALGPAPDDLREVDWTRAVLPGDFCEIAGTVTLTDSEGRGESKTWGRVHVALLPDLTTYGDVTGDDRDEAAVAVGCDNGGGTAAGQLTFAAVVLTARDGRLYALGTLPTQHESYAEHPPLVSTTKLKPGRATMTELWYRPSDANCCPSGERVSTWTLEAADVLVLSDSKVTS
ncbi:hypothetical protein [Streptomyces ambofaciens]|uniref:hypothetical protein n=1 Tax=Streptomyces ambofaciens TaxID=1889 RepID=UPI0007B500DE|nr:hypothetical protein [Streptomyces ambofaciens]